MATAVLYNLQPNSELANGTIETYEADGTTPQATYKDNQQISAHDTTIQLDTYGLPPGGSIWLGSNLTYKLIFKDYTGTVIYAVNNVEPGGNTFTAGIQLGGNLDVNGNLITSNSANPDINITPYGAGQVEIQNLRVNGLVVDSNIDINGSNILFDNGTGLLDSSLNELIKFTTTASAVNYLNVTNTATTVAPLLSVAGDDTNIDLRLSAKGTGKLRCSPIDLSLSGSLSGITPLITLKGSPSGTYRQTVIQFTNAGNSNYVRLGVLSDVAIQTSYHYTLPNEPGNNDFMMILGSGDGTTLSTTTSPQVTAGALLPKGTSAQRVNTAGLIRYNTTDSCIEYYNGSNWIQLKTGT